MPERRLAGRLNEAVGTVEAVDNQARTISIRTDVNTVVLYVDRNTTAFLEKRTGTLRDLKKGTRVRAGYEIVDGKSRGRWIELTVEPSGAAAITGPAITNPAPDGGVPSDGGPALSAPDAGTPKP